MNNLYIEAKFDGVHPWGHTTRGYLEFTVRYEDPWKSSTFTFDPAILQANPAVFNIDVYSSAPTFTGFLTTSQQSILYLTPSETTTNVVEPVRNISFRNADDSPLSTSVFGYGSITGFGQTLEAYPSDVNWVGTYSLKIVAKYDSLVGGLESSYSFTVVLTDYCASPVLTPSVAPSPVDYLYTGNDEVIQIDAFTITPGVCAITYSCS